MQFNSLCLITLFKSSPHFWMQNLCSIDCNNRLHNFQNTWSKNTICNLACTRNKNTIHKRTQYIFEKVCQLLHSLLALKLSYKIFLFPDKQRPCFPSLPYLRPNLKGYQMPWGSPWGRQIPMSPQAKLKIANAPTPPRDCAAVVKKLF